MSAKLRAAIARRPLLAGLLGVLGLAAAGGAAYEAGLFGPFYPDTPYDDLLDLLPTRYEAITIGKNVLASDPAYRPAPAAKALRERIGKTPLADILAADAAGDKLTEVDGWLLPATLAALCSLAAKADV